jgi:hypothetical protein
MATTLKRHRRRAVLVALAAAIAMAVLMMAALSARGPATAHAAVKHAKHAQTARHRGHYHAASNQTGGGQTGGPGETSGESSSESEQGQGGEPAGGHADPAGAAGSNCTGNCVQ